MSQIKQRTNKISKITMSTALVASSFSFVAPLASASQFADVKQSNSHYEAIINLAGRGIINGYEDGTFKPGNFVTRAHAAKIIARTLNLDTTNVVDPQFKDVNKNSEYYPYIAALANAGVINGFDGKFNPSGNVTRGQMSKIIARAFGVSSTGDLSFKDVPATHEYAEYIRALAENGITLGKEDGKFAMHELVTRGQLASFVTRAEKATAVTSIAGSIDKISADTVQVDGKTYKVAKSSEFLTTAVNTTALQDAKIIAIVKDNEITAVEELTLYNGEQFDGQDHKFKTLSVNKSLTKLMNVNAEEINHELPTTRVTYDNVTTQNLNAFAAAVAVASLNNTVAIEQQTVLKFVRSMIAKVALNAKVANIEADAASTIQSIDASNTSNLTLTGQFNEVTVPGNAHIAGAGLIRTLMSNAQNLRGLTIAPGFVIDAVQANNTNYSWADALTALNINQGNAQTPSTNTNQGNSQTPSENVNQGNTQTPGENTNQGNTQTPSENVNQGNTQKPNENTNQGNTQTPPVVDTTEQDNAAVTSVLTQLETVVNALTLTNDNALTELETAVSILNKDGVAVSITKFDLTQATESTVGKVVFEITVSKGNATETYKATKEILALETTEQTNPGGANDTTVQDTESVQKVVAAVEGLLAGLEATNLLTIDSVKSEVERLATDGVDVTVSKFTMVKATSENVGTVDIEVTVQKGQATQTASITKEIAVFQGMNPGDSTGQQETTTQDSAIVQTVLETVKQELQSYTVSNESTKSDLEQKLALLNTDGAKLEVTTFNFQAAKPGVAGQIEIVVTVSKGNAVETYRIPKEIAALEDQKEPEVTDAEAVDATLTAVKEKVDSLVITNESTASSIEDLLKGLATEGVTVSIASFSITPATTTAAGELKLVVKASKGEVHKEYNETKSIEKLPVTGPTAEDEKVASDVLAAIQAALTTAEFKNDVNESTIRNLFAAVDLKDTTVQVTAINVTKATSLEAGLITFDVVVTKNGTAKTSSQRHTIKQLQGLTEHQLDKVPVVSENGTIVLDGKEKVVSEQVAEALKSLQQIEEAQQATVRTIIADSGDGQGVELQAVTIEAAENTTALDFANIPNDVDMTIVGNNVEEIKNLQSTKNVDIETAGAIAFTGTTDLNQVTISNATNITGLKAKHLVAQNATQIEFDATTVIETAEFNNVQEVKGLNVIEAKFNANSDIELANVNAQVINIDRQTMVARVASLSTRVAANTEITISVTAGTEVGEININRTDTVVDIYKEATVSRINVQSSNTKIIANTIANVTVLNGVTNLTLGNSTTPATIGDLAIVLSSDMVISGNATIESLAISGDATKKVKIDQGITVKDKKNPEFIDQSQTIQLIDGTKFGYYKLSDATNVSYIVQHQNAAANVPETITSGTAYNASGIKIDALTKKIALYGADKKLITTITTDPSERPKFKVSDIDANLGQLLLDTTFTKLTDINGNLNHLIVLKHTDSPTGYQVTNLITEIGTIPTSQYEFKTNTNNANVLKIPLANISSLKYLIIKADDLIYDTIATTYKNQRIVVLKEFAQIAKDYNDESILRDYLTQVFAIEGETYNSIYTPTIIEKLLNDKIANIEELVNLTTEQQTDKAYQEVVSASELWLGAGVTKVSGDGTNSTVTVEGSNILIKANATGTDIVRFKDANNQYSLLKVDVVKGATDADTTVTATLIANEVVNATASTQILHGGARLYPDGEKTYIVPEEIDSKSIIYTPAATTAAVGTFQSAIATGAGGYTLVDVTPTAVSKADLNLGTTINNVKKTATGYVTTDTELYFYAIAAGSDQYEITDGIKKTAVYIESDGVTIDAPIIAQQSFGITDLAIGQVKEITSQTTNTTMHTAKEVNKVVIFASKENDNATFKIESQDGKITLVNVQTTASGVIKFKDSNSADLLKIGVVKQELTKANTTIITPMIGDMLKEDIIRLVGNEAYATGTGTQRVVYSNGEQVDVKVTLTDDGYTLEVTPAQAITLTASQLDLLNISSIQQNGTSASAVNVENSSISITPIANQSGKTEFVVTDSDGKKVILYVKVNAGVLTDITADASNDLYRVAKTTVAKDDLGFTANIQSISERTEVARGASKPTEATIYATGAGTTTFTVLSTDNKKALVNVTVSKVEPDSGTVTANELVVSAEVVKHDATSTLESLSGAGKTIATDAIGKGIVRIEDNMLYALQEGSVDLAITGETKLFYRISVVKNEVTGQYSFTTPTLVSKAVYSSTELGLKDITSASSSDEAIATVEYVANKVTITTQTKDAEGRITVTGPNGQTFIYMKKDGNTLYNEIEKATATVDVSKGGLTNVSSLKEWSNVDIVRSYESGTMLDFFVLQNGNTSYKVTDSTGKTTIINLPVTTVKVNVDGEMKDRERQIVPEVVKEVVGVKSGTPEVISAQAGEIISGASIRLYEETDGTQYAYAVTTGETLVKLTDGTLVKYTVSIADGLYSIDSETVTNGLTKTDAQLGLSGNLTIEGIDSTVATAVAVGKTITFHGKVDNGFTSALVKAGDQQVRIQVSITGGVMTVDPIRHVLGANLTAINIHESAKDIAWITSDGKTINILKDGTFYYVEHYKDAVVNTKVVKKLVITKDTTAGLEYKVQGPDDVKHVIKTNIELGLENALEVVSGYNTDVVSAAMVDSDFVMYQKGTGSTDVTVKDGQGQKTLMHVTSDANLAAYIPQVLKADNTTPFTFDVADYDLTGTLTVDVKNKNIAQLHSNGQLYLLAEGTTYATVDDGTGTKALVAITVTKVSGKLTATVTTISKTPTQLAAGATTVAALPGTQTNAAIVRVAGNKVYAIGAGETKVKLNNQIVTVIVKEEANAYSLTIGTAVNFITLPIGEGTFTLADVTQTNAALVTQDDNGTAADKTDDQLIISVNAPNGSLDLTISDSTGKKTVHHIKVENGEITDPPVQALEELTAEVTAIANTVLPVVGIPVEVVQIHEHNTENGTVQKLHLLKEGKAALKGSNGLVNVVVTRDATTKYFTATQTVVKKAIKEELTLDPTDTNPKFTVVKTTVEGVDKYALHALDVTNAPVTYYTDNYRLVAHTQLVNDEYVLTVEERHKQEVDYASYGLTHSTAKPLTVHSDNEDLVKVEVTDAGELVLYAGAGLTPATGTTTITVTETTHAIGNKQITIKATRAEEGTISYVVQGQVDAVKFADIGINPADGTITVEGHNESYVQANVTATGISLSAQTPGTTSFLVKQGSVVKAIYNITVADGKAVPVLVKYDGALTDNVITGDGTILLKNATYYAVAEGVALYESNDTTATQLRVVKNTETNLYSITPTVFNMVKGATNLDFVVNAGTTINVSNSSIADAYVANGTLYIIGKSQGSADILVTTGTNKAIVHAHVTASGVTANVVNSFNPITSEGAFTSGTFTGNEWIQVRNNKLYALTVKTSTIKFADTLVTAEVTRNIDTNEFDIKLTRVKHQFENAIITKVNSADDVVQIDGNTIYAKKAGKMQLYVTETGQTNPIVRDVEVVANADGTYKFVVTDAKVQRIIKASDLGLTLSPTTDVAIRSITGSNILTTQVIGQDLYVYALGTGSAELTIDDQTVVYISITSTNNVFVIADPVIARDTILTTGTLSKVDATDSKIRIEANDVYGLQEGTSLVKETKDNLVTLHKVVLARDNNALKVTASPIEKAFTTVTGVAVTASNVRSEDGKLVAIATGEDTFVYNNVTYRVNVDESTGDMTIETLQTETIDLSEVFDSITGAPSSTLLDIQKSGNQLNVTAEQEGTEVIQVTGKSLSGQASDNPSPVHVKVTVTKDGTEFKVAYEIVKVELTTTQLGFLPTAVSSITNGYVKIDGSNVVVYPGKTDAGITAKQYFTITGAGGAQAIYSVDIAGVTLVNGAVTGYTVEPLHVDIPISEVGMNPEKVAIDGTAKYTIKTKKGIEVLEVVLNKTDDTSYIIVRGEGNTYKSIEVSATSDYTTSYKVHNTLVLNNVTNMSPTASYVKSVNDGSKTVLYATSTGKFAYEDGGKLYNSEVTAPNGKYSFVAGTAAPAVALTVPRLVDGELNLDLTGNSPYTPSKIGEAIYATTAGYKKVEVTVKADKQIESQIIDVPSKEVSNTVDSVSMLKAPSTVKVDGLVVYGGTVDDIGETIVVQTVKGQGIDAKVTLYTAIIEADGNTIKYDFAPVTRDILTDTGWVSGTNIASITLNDPTMARVENGVLHFLRAGDVTVTITSSTGLKHMIKYNVDEQTYAAKIVDTTGENVISYRTEEMPNLGQMIVTFTFDLNIIVPDDVAATLGDDFYVVATETTAIESRNNKLRVNVDNSLGQPQAFKLYLPEYGAVYNEFSVTIDPTNTSNITIQSTNPALKFKFIQ